MKLTKDEKWKVVEENDDKYDGQFFYAVKTTKIFCRPSCKSKLPLRKNVDFYLTSKEAQDNGFRACKRCRPDLLEYNPNKELISDIKEYIEKNYYTNINIEKLSIDFAISQRNLNKIFKEFEEMSLMNYIRKIRVEKSKELLETSDVVVLEVALMVGFLSLSNYYQCFKKEVGITPKKYRELNKI